jgi:hypothetical protein
MERPTESPDEPLNTKYSKHDQICKIFAFDHTAGVFSNR